MQIEITEEEFNVILKALIYYIRAEEEDIKSGYYALDIVDRLKEELYKEE